MENTMNQIKVTYTYNGKTLEIADTFSRNLQDKDLNIYAWKAINFFGAEKVDRTPVNA